MSSHEGVNIILASASPRRRELLGVLGYEFEVVVSHVDEGTFSSEGMGAVEYAEVLALAKAKQVGGDYPDCLVIGADTVVDFEGEIIGKAGDSSEAERITRKLFSKEHKVITAVAVVRVSDGTEVVASETTVVYPRQLTEWQVAEHISSGLWADKAGAYAIKEAGDEFVERIEGSLTNVMGFPVELVDRLLKDVLCN